MKICYRYSLEAARRGPFNEYQQHMFLVEIYRIQPNYCAVCLGFSKMLGKRVVQYVPNYTKSTIKKKMRRIYQMMLMRCFCMFFFLIFVIKAMLWVLISTSRCNSNGYPQHMPL